MTAETDVQELSAGYVPPSLLAWRALERAAYAQIDVTPVLDLGAGLGVFTHVVAPQAIGVDLDGRQLKMGMSSATLKSALCADLRQLPVASDSVAAIIANCVFEHIPGVELVVAEVARVLRPGGQVQLTVPLDSLDRGFAVRIGWYARMRNRQLSHINLLTQESWTQLWEEAGLEVVRARSVVSLGQTRRWDLIDAPLFLGVRRYTCGNLYQRIVLPRPKLLRLHRRLSEPLSRWVIRGQRAHDEPVCVFFELRKK